jgi:hypothetical protein
MRRADLIKIVEENLVDLGFTRGSWLWQPRSSELIVILGGMLKTVKLRTNITKRALIFEMGRIAGLAEAAGMSPRSAMQGFQAASGPWIKPNGSGHHQAETFVGMPA